MGALVGTRRPVVRRLFATRINRSVTSALRAVRSSGQTARPSRAVEFSAFLNFRARDSYAPLQARSRSRCNVNAVCSIGAN